MVNPCCCMSLQRGTIIVAIIDAVLNGIMLALLTLAFIGVILIDPDDTTDDYDITRGEKNEIIISCLIAIIVCICQILLAWHLRRSARENNYQGCKRWLIITVVLLAISIISVAIRGAAGSSALDITSGAIGIVYRIYVMFVVVSFMKELNNAGLSNPAHYNTGAA